MFCTANLETSLSTAMFTCYSKSLVYRIITTRARDIGKLINSSFATGVVGHWPGVLMNMLVEQQTQTKHLKVKKKPKEYL